MANKAEKQDYWCLARGEAGTKKGDGTPVICLEKNQLTPLVDGPEIFGRMGKMFDYAKKYIYITAWSLRLRTPIKGKKLEDWLLTKAAEGVKVRILWCDLDEEMSNFNERAAVKKLLSKDKSNNIVAVISAFTDLSTNYALLIQTLHGGHIGSHHQKTVVVDGKFAICSGADITTGAINKKYWHDAAVYIRGKGVKEIEENFINRWNDEAPNDGIEEKLELNEKAKSSNTCKTVLTMPSWYWRTTEILSAYIELIRHAKKSIYIENQYIRSHKVGKELVRAAKKGVDIFILIPKYPEEIDPGKKNMPINAKIMHYSQYKVLKAIVTGEEKWMTETVNMLDSDNKSNHLSNVKVLSPLRKKTPYIHAKVMIVDGQKATVGSANMNPRSLDGVVDSELNVVIDDEKFCSDFYDKLQLSMKRYKVVDHDIDQDEVLTRFNQFNLAERDKFFKTNTYTKTILNRELSVDASAVFGQDMRDEKDPRLLREIFLDKFSFLL